MLYYYRNQGYCDRLGCDDKNPGDGRSSDRDAPDSDSDSELDIEGPNSPDMREDGGEQDSTLGDRDRSRDESGSEDDPLTKTSPAGGGVVASGIRPAWPHLQPFSFSSQMSQQLPALSSQTINKMTSHFWGFDPSRPTLPHPHPLDNFSLSFPNLHSSLSNHFFKMTSPDSEAGRQLFQFRSTS